MQISTDNFITAIEKWAENDLISHGSVLQKGFTTFLVLQSKTKLKQMISQLKFLADDNGMFEVEDLHTNLSSALDAMNGIFTIPLINYNFDKQDLEQVFNYAKELAS